MDKGEQTGHWFWRNRYGVNVVIFVLEGFPAPHFHRPGGLSRLPDFGFYKFHLYYFKNILAYFGVYPSLNRILLFAIKLSLTKIK